LDAREDMTEQEHLYDKRLNSKQSLPGKTTPKTRTTTYNDKAAPWNRSNHLVGTRLLPSSDDSDTSRTSTEKVMDETTGLTKITCSASSAYLKSLL
jgi:hypothetical protein